jgi:hypothetical protein
LYKIKATVRPALADSITHEVGNLVFDKNLQHLLPKTKPIVPLDLIFGPLPKALFQFPDFDNFELLLDRQQRYDSRNR